MCHKRSGHFHSVFYRCEDLETAGPRMLDHRNKALDVLSGPSTNHNWNKNIILLLIYITFKKWIVVQSNDFGCKWQIHLVKSVSVSYHDRGQGYCYNSSFTHGIITSTIPWNIQCNGYLKHDLIKVIWIWNDNNDPL